VAGLCWWLAAADRPSRSSQVPGGGRRRQATGGGVVGLPVARGRRAGSRGSPWFPLRCNQLKGVRWRGRLWGPVPAPQGSAVPGPVLSATLFGCCPDGLYVPVPAPLAPPASGPAPRKFFSGAPSSLISSEDFPGLALRVDGPARAQLRKLRQQSKQRGERGSWPVT
jgi:hypothetical protein